MKASILAAAAAALGASGVMAAPPPPPVTHVATLFWFGEPGCTDTNNFISSTVTVDGGCHSIGPFLDNGVRLSGCSNAGACSCSIFKGPNCDVADGAVTVNFGNGGSLDCPFIGGGFEWFSAACNLS